MPTCVFEGVKKDFRAAICRIMTLLDVNVLQHLFSEVENAFVFNYRGVHELLFTYGHTCTWVGGENIPSASRSSDFQVNKENFEIFSNCTYCPLYYEDVL